MINFLKVVKISLKHRWRIAALLLNSLLIGVLWGSSISAIYPFVEVVLSGNTIETWIVGEVDRTDTKIGELNDSNVDLQAAIAKEATLEQRAKLLNNTRQLEAEQKANKFYRSVLPWIEGRVPKTPYGTLILVLGFLIGVTVLKGICLILNSVLVAQIAHGTALTLRRQFFSSATKMDQLLVESKGTSAMQTMLIYNLNLVTAGLVSVYGKGTREPLKMLVCFVIAATISWKLLLLTIVVAPFAAVLINRVAQKMRLAAQRELGGITGVLQSTMESLSSLRVVRIYNRERTEKARFNRFSKVLYNLGVKQAFFDSLLRPTSELAGIICISIALLASGYLVLNDTTHLFGIRMSERPMTISTVFLFFAMLAGISDPARKMSEIYNNLVRADVSAKGMYDFFDNKPTVCVPEKVTEVRSHSKSIRFRNVNFAYNLNQITLKKVNLEIPFGQSVALVGANGSGKSTMIGLLARFYDPQWGAVMIDGVDLKQANPRQIRKQMAMVSQTSVLFRGSLLDNIRYGNSNASFEQVMEAARLAHVTDFLGSLPKGIHSEVGDRGHKLSGGQRQRTALARAIVADPRILILDEATSQVDMDAERMIHDSLEEFLKQRTSIIVSHRLSTLEIVDRIIVLEQGEIVDDLNFTEYVRKYDMFANPAKAA